VDGDGLRALTLCETAVKDEGGSAYDPGPGGTSPMRSNTVSCPPVLRTAPASHELRLLMLACGSFGSRRRPRCAGLSGGDTGGAGASLPPGQSGVRGE
jgi:hypothetical protein